MFNVLSRIGNSIPSFCSLPDSLEDHDYGLCFVILMDNVHYVESQASVFQLGPTCYFLLFPLFCFLTLHPLSKYSNLIRVV